MIVLNNDQQDELIEQFVELQVDNMDTKTMMEWITDELIFQYGKLSKEELKERVDTFNEDLFDELVDNVTSLKVISSQELEGDISTYTDDDYADKVDTLVDRMKSTK